MIKKVKICSLSDIPINGIYKYDLNGEKIMLRNYNGKILAVSALCTHRGVDLTEKGIFKDEYVICKNHLATYNMITGEVVQPPASLPLDTYKVYIDENEVFIEIE